MCSRAGNGVPISRRVVSRWRLTGAGRLSPLQGQTGA
ncbi:hypothetical protein [Roseinatronobacter sp. S2]